MTATNTQAPAATEAPSEPSNETLASQLEDCAAGVAVPESPEAFRNVMSARIMEAAKRLRATPAPAVGASPEKWSPDAKTWAAYVAGMIETYLNFDKSKLSYANPNKGREAAIAGIIERRMWSGPAMGASVQPVQASLSELHFALLGAANYIDVLGGDSQKYRVVLASSTPTKGGA